MSKNKKGNAGDLILLILFGALAIYLYTLAGTGR